VIPRAALVASLVVASSGCIEDRCTIDDSVRLLFVYPDDASRTDTTNPHVFYSIQDAVDAAPAPEGDGTETTVCVADGVYREQLTIPPGVRLLGRGADRVRLRPPGGRDDETLVTVATDALTSVTIQDVDLGGTTAACVEASGGGALRILTSRILGCGIGVRAMGGGDAGTLEIAATPLARNGTGLLITSMADVLVRDTDLTGNDFVALADNRSGDGAVRFERVRLADNGAAITVHGGTARLTAVDSAADHPLLSGSGVEATLRSSGLSTVGPIVSLESGDLLATHVTVLGSGTLAEVGSGTATFMNSILEPDVGDGVTVRSSLVQDDTLGDGNVAWVDPELTGWTPAAGSAVRCAGMSVADDAVDLRGNPRPFREGKLPDLGAVELQEGCP